MDSQPAFGPELSFLSFLFGILRTGSEKAWRMEGLLDGA